MTQVALMRLVYPLLRAVRSDLSRRQVYMVALDVSMWIHARLWCVRDPVTWWKWRRRLRLLRRGLWEVQA